MKQAQAYVVIRFNKFKFIKSIQINILVLVYWLILIVILSHVYIGIACIIGKMPGTVSVLSLSP
jgi:hypothetical protein